MRRALLTLGLATLAIAGCTDSAETQQLTTEVATLRKQVGDLEDQLDATQQRMTRLERRGAERERPTERAPETREAPAAATVATADTTEDGQAAPVDAVRFGQFLETDQGQEVFVAAMRAYQERQAEDRRKRVVSAVVAPFAKKAYLSQDQAEQLSGLLEDAAQSVRDVWGSMREVEPEQRQQQLMANIQRSQDIRKETEAKAAEFLSSAQHDMFMEEAGNLMGMGMPGGGRRPGGDRQQGDSPAR